MSLLQDVIAMSSKNLQFLMPDPHCEDGRRPLCLDVLRVPLRELVSLVSRVRAWLSLD